MSSLYLDLQNGISGDMAVAALLSLAGDGEAKMLRKLEEKLGSLPLSGFHIESRREQRHGIWGNLFSVVTDGSVEEPRDYRSIHTLISDADLEKEEKDLTLALFETIAHAEAKVHGTSAEEVHFHEIGAVDSIVDIVSFSILFLGLEPALTFSSIPALGSGVTESRHGTIPVPAPATLEILKGTPVRGTGREVELVTPTGASIIKNIVSRFGPLPGCTIKKIGYGFGQRISTLPNVLRVLQIEEHVHEQDHESGTVSMIEATIDDSTPEEVAFLQELLFKEDALDVWVTPVYMKKNRPGFNISVLSSPENFDRLCATMLRKSSSFGLRFSIHERLCLRRKKSKVSTEYGDISVKIGMIGEEIVKYAPEYEDCRGAAQKHNVPIQVVFDAAKREAAKKL